MYQEYAGCKFVFASYNYSEKYWTVQPYRFMLTGGNNKLFGDFIRSNWFQKKYCMNSQGLFVVLQISTDIFIKTVEKDMNSLKNPFPSLYDIPPYVVRGSYFVISSQIINELIENSETTHFTLRASNNPWDKLKLSIYKCPEGNILITHPSFEIKIL
jgi:hypothetical protein